MPEILFNAQWPDGTPRAHQKIAVVLIDGGAGGSHGDDMIGDTIHVTLDATGQAVVQLVGVDQIDPAGCHYRCTLAGSSPSLVRRITPVASTPDGTSWADPSILAVSPVPPAWVPLEGPAGPAGPPAADVGTLAARPAAGSVDAGSLFTATDDEQGRLWVAEAGAWVPAAPSVQTAGAGRRAVIAELSAAAPVTTVASLPVRLAGLSTAAFPLPAAATFHATPLSIVGSGGSGDTTVQFRWSTNGWSTSTLLAPLTRFTTTGSPYFIDGFMGVSLPLPPTGLSLPVGTSVQVGVFLFRSDAKTMTVLQDASQGLNPAIWVVGG